MEKEKYPNLSNLSQDTASLYRLISSKFRCIVYKNELLKIINDYQPTLSAEFGEDIEQKIDYHVDESMLHDVKHTFGVDMIMEFARTLNRI